MIAAKVPDGGGDIPRSVECYRPGPALLGGRHSPRHAAMPASSALIAVLILDRPLCVDCIATKSVITLSEVDQYLNAIAHSPLELRRSENGRCHSCGEGRPVFSLHRALTTGST